MLFYGGFRQFDVLRVGLSKRFLAFEIGYFPEEEKQSSFLVSKIMLSASRNVEKGLLFIDTERQIIVPRFRIIALVKRRLSRKMRVSVEEYFLINFLMDFLFLYLASRGTWFLKPGRLLLASFSGSAYALWDAYVRLPTVLHAPAFACMMLIAFPVRDGRLFLRTVFLSTAGLFVFGSAVRIGVSAGGGTIAAGGIGALFGAVNLSVLKSMFQRSASTHSARFRVRFKEETAEFTAVIDTGNLLKEPLSALPVLIADDEALGKRFIKTALTEKSLREAAFASVGGDGQMKCLRADEIRVNVLGRWVSAPDMWLGLYPGRMRGGVHALAPPVVYGKTRK